MHNHQRKKIESHWPLNEFDFKFSVRKNLFGWQFPRLLCQVRKEGKKHSKTSVMMTNISSNVIHFTDHKSSLDLELGETYEMRLCFPCGKKQRFHFRAAYINEKSFGVRPIDASSSLKKDVGQLLLNTNPAMTPKKIFECGFLIRSVNEAVSFSIVTEFEDFLKVLELRQIAYQDSDKIRNSHPKEKMEDQFDTRSTILIAKHFGRVVASVRFIDSEDHESGEHQQFGPLPDFLPSNSDITEITRICTHPDYRKSGLLSTLFVEASHLMVMDNREWILGSATKKLLPLYLKIGFVATGKTYRHSSLGNEVHEIIYAKKQDLLRGRGVSPWVWLKLYRIAYIYAQRLGYLESMTLFDRLRTAAYSLCHYFRIRI